MLPVIVVFDLDLPFVASQAFGTADRSFKPGDAVPWRELGIHELTLHAWYRAGLVRCEQASAVVAAKAAPAEQQAPKQRQQRR